MNPRAPLIDADGEVRELSAADMRKFKPATEVLPLELQKTLGIGSRGPQKAPTKVAVTVRYSPDVLAAFKATGAGWQTRMNEDLREGARRRRVMARLGAKSSEPDQAGKKSA